MRREAAINHAVLLLFALAALYPIAQTLLLAVGGSEGVSSLHHGLTFQNFEKAWSEGGFGPSLVTSAIVAGAVSVGTTVLSTLSGFGLGVARSRAADAVFYFFLLGIVFPLEGYLIPLYYELRTFNLLDSYQGLILAETALLLPFGTFWMRAYFRTVPPSIVEAARTDGARSWTLLWRVLVPSARPAILTLVVIVFVWTWNDFLLPLVVLSGETMRTAPLGLAFFVGQRLTDIPSLAAAAMIISVPVIVIFLIFQRQFIRGMLAGSVKG